MRRQSASHSIALPTAAFSDFWMTHFAQRQREPFDKKAHAMFENFADQLQCMIYRCEVSPLGKTRVTYTNRAVEWIYEMTPEQLVSNPAALMDLVHPDDLERITSALIKSHREASPWHEQYRMVLPEKGCCWREARATVTRTAFGGTVWDGIIFDITQVKADAQDREQFFAMAGHELRTPISGVLGYADLLAETRLDADQRELLGVVVQSGEHLLSLVNDLMDLSKLASGHFSIVEREFSVSQLCQSACGMIGPKAGEHGIQIENTVCDSAPPMLRGDSLRISQALVNLLANAVKHGGRSRVRLSATVDKLSLEGGTHLLTLRVEDDGPGVPERDRERIFEPYVQLGESRHQTTGLGLTLSRKLARQMGGNLTVATSELGGARFDLSVKVSGPPFQ